MVTKTRDFQTQGVHMMMIMTNTKAWRMKRQVLQMLMMLIIINTIICRMSGQGITKTRYLLQKSWARIIMRRGQLKRRTRKVRMTLKMSSMILRTVVIPEFMKNLIISNAACHQKFQLIIKVCYKMKTSSLFNQNYRDFMNSLYRIVSRQLACYRF